MENAKEFLESIYNGSFYTILLHLIQLKENLSLAEKKMYSSQDAKILATGYCMHFTNTVLLFLERAGWH